MRALRYFPRERPDPEFNLHKLPTQNPLMHKHKRAMEPFPKTLQGGEMGVTWHGPQQATFTSSLDALCRPLSPGPC